MDKEDIAFEIDCSKTYTQKSLGIALGRAESWVFEHVIYEGCPHVRMGRHYLISGRSFRDFVESQSVSRKRNNSRGKPVYESSSSMSDGVVPKVALPIIHIDQLADLLGIERRWVNENWLKKECSDGFSGPVPHFRDGNNIFFTLKALGEWADERACCTLPNQQPPDAARGICNSDAPLLERQL